MSRNCLILSATLIFVMASSPQASADQTDSSGIGFFKQFTSAFSGQSDPAEEDERPSTRNSEGGFLTQLFGGTRASKAPEPVTLNVRTTAYTHSEAGHEAWGSRNAIGTQLQATEEYTSAAADWSRFPVGTKFRIVGEPTVYIIDDYGSALVGTNTIDLYKSNRSQVRNWGVRQMSIEILEVGCFENAHSILKGRQRNRTCRRMAEALSSQDLSEHPLAAAIEQH